jgi:hypothetical protein
MEYPITQPRRMYYQIEASDGTLFKISKEATQLADFLQTQTELVTENEAMKIEDSTPPHYLRLIVEFLEIAKDKPSISIRRPLLARGDLTLSGMPDWACKWLDSIFENHELCQAWDTVFDLVNIADFINCEMLVKVLIAKVASRICTMDEMKKKQVFAPSRDLTDEEKLRIREENKWAEVDPPAED